MRSVTSLILMAMAFLLAGCGVFATASPTLEPTPLPSPALIPSPTPKPELTVEEIQSLALSSVLIEAMIEEDGELVTDWSGSGTILSSDGVILTNAHVVMDAESLVVGLISRTDQPPIPSYYAEPIEINNVLDLGLIKITSDLDGNPVEGGQLKLPFVMRGDSDDIDLGQTIHVLGYPGVGGETLTLTKGTVSGFVSEDLGRGVSERVWIKSDVDIAPGNSGGTAVNDLGLLIGIPTLVITDEPTGSISRLRPANLVSYLIRQAPPKIVDASVYEPNDTIDSAYGPLEAGDIYSAFIHEYDVDLYFIEVETLDTIWVFLDDIAEDADYDLYLLNPHHHIADYSESEEDNEYIIFQPRETGTYYIVVNAYEGYSLEQPYLLQTTFDGDTAPPLLPEAAWVTVMGRLLDANTDRGIEGAIVSLLLPGITGEQFLDEDLNQDLIQSSSTTDTEGVFLLPEIPRGQTYTMVIVIETDTLWVNDWLAVDLTDPAIIDLGDLTIGSP